MDAAAAKITLEDVRAAWRGPNGESYESYEVITPMTEVCSFNFSPPHFLGRGLKCPIYVLEIWLSRTFRL